MVVVSCSECMFWFSMQVWTGKNQKESKSGMLILIFLLRFLSTDPRSRLDPTNLRLNIWINPALERYTPNLVSSAVSHLFGWCYFLSAIKGWRPRKSESGNEIAGCSCLLSVFSPAPKSDCELDSESKFAWQRFCTCTRIIHSHTARHVLSSSPDQSHHSDMSSFKTCWTVVHSCKSSRCFRRECSTESINLQCSPQIVSWWR